MRPLVRRTTAIAITTVAIPIALTLTACGSDTSTQPKPPTDDGTAITSGSIATTGGSFTVSRPGSPLDGLTITVPSGAIGSALSIAIDSSPNTSITRRDAVNPITPIVGITTNLTGSTSAPVTLKIPAKVPSGTFPVITSYDKSSGAMTVLTTVAWDSVSVTTVLDHFTTPPALTKTTTRLAMQQNVPVSRNASQATLAPRFADTPPSVNPIQLFINAIPTAVLMRDYDTGYRPGTDDWEFNAPNTAIGSTTFGSAVTSLWYYAAKPGGGSLTGRFVLAKDVPLSDRAGIRWAATVQRKGDPDNLYAIAHALVTQSTGPNAATFSENTFLSVRAAFAMAPVTPLPQVVVVGTTIGGSTGEGGLMPVIVYKAQGRMLSVASPVAPGDQQQVLNFPEGQQMAPYTTTIDGTATQLFTPILIGINSFITTDLLASTYAQVANNTIGDDVFPKFEIHGRDGRMTGRLYDTLYVADSLRYWFECPTCQYGYPPKTEIPTTANLLTYAEYELTGSTWQNKGLVFPAAGVVADTNSVSAGQDRVLGGPVLTAATPDASPVFGLYLDWHQYTLRRLSLAISPAAPSQTPNTPLSVKVTFSPTSLPPHVTYEWDFGDGTAKAQVHDDPNAQHTYAALGNYTIVVRLIDDRNSQIIGTTSTPVKVQDAASFWRLQTLTLVSTSGTVPASTDAAHFTYAKDSTYLAQLSTTPTDGSFGVYTYPGGGILSGNVVYFQIASPGMGTSVTALTAGLPQIPIARNWQSAQCSSQVDCPDDVLSITGSATTGSIVGGEGDGNVINATKDGLTLSGTFSLSIPLNNGQYYKWNFKFTAKTP